MVDVKTGDRVERTDPSSRHDVGEVVEVGPEHIRVRWDSHGRRTWLMLKACPDRWRPVGKDGPVQGSGRKIVVQVTQSPMNARRWLLVMECGHEVWVTAKSKPTSSTRVCPRCREMHYQEASS